MARFSVKVMCVAAESVMIHDLVFRTVVVCGEIGFHDGEAEAIGDALT